MATEIPSQDEISSKKIDEGDNNDNELGKDTPDSNSDVSWPKKIFGATKSTVTLTNYWLRQHLLRIYLSESVLNARRSLADAASSLEETGVLITVYVSIKDPYSYLLLQILNDIQNRFVNVTFDFKTILNKQQQMFPAPEMWDENAFRDGIYLSNLYALDFPKEPPTYKETDFDEKVTAQLLHYELMPGYLDNSLKVFEKYWHNDMEGLNNILDDAVRNHHRVYQQHLVHNEEDLKNNGHYLSALLHYGGEFYWGIDRIQYLEERLNSKELCINAPQIKYNLGQKLFCSTPRVENDAKSKESLRLYWSLRCPYSYLGLIRAVKLCNHYNIPLDIKPVLPMDMRFMKVPRAKERYIIQDAKREAFNSNISFGSIADPLQKGVERCYALYDYAKSNNQGNNFLVIFARAVWSEGINSLSDEGLRTIVERSGLEWVEAQKLLNEDSWRYWANDNLKELYSLNLWGVPCFQYKNVNVFGQDKLYCIEQEIRKELGISV